jgi:hypothetical protein
MASLHEVKQESFPLTHLSNLTPLLTKYEYDSLDSNSFLAAAVSVVSLAFREDHQNRSEVTSTNRESNFSNEQVSYSPEPKELTPLPSLSYISKANSNQNTQNNPPALIVENGKKNQSKKNPKKGNTKTKKSSSMKQQLKSLFPEDEFIDGNEFDGIRNDEKSNNNAVKLRLIGCLMDASESCESNYFGVPYKDDADDIDVEGMESECSNSNSTCSSNPSRKSSSKRANKAKRNSAECDTNGVKRRNRSQVRKFTLYFRKLG